MAATQSSVLPEEDVDHCFLKILSDFLNSPNEETTRKAISELSSIGWKADLSRDEDGGINSQYKSPDGTMTFDSLKNVCSYLTEVNSLNELAKYSSSPEISGTHEKDLEEGPVYCPSAMLDWFRAAGDKRQGGGSRDLSTKAKQHLLAIGWSLPKVIKNKANQKKEMRYISPKNRTFYSLVKACEEVMKDGGSTSLASHGMQSQVHSQGQSQISLQNRSQARHQLLSQNTIVNAGVQNSASLPLALPSVTSLTQTSMQNSAGQRINMQSGTAQNFVGNSSYASHGMQSQVHNQGKSQIPSQNRSQARHQLLSQNVQNTIVNAGAQNSASLPPALPSVTILTQTSMQNSAGQRINMQSGTAQNFVGNSSYASHGMQSQVHNQGQSQIPLQNRSQARHQLLSQNVQNTIVNAGAQNSASLPPALPSVTSLTQTSMQNSAGQRINMQSGTAQNFVGTSLGQGIPSNIFSKTQGRLRIKLKSARKPVSAQQQIQQPGGHPLSMQPQQQLKQQEKQLKQHDNQKDE